MNENIHSFALVFDKQNDDHAINYCEFEFYIIMLLIEMFQEHEIMRPNDESIVNITKPGIGFVTKEL